MSASRLARISSRLTSGSVWPIGIGRPPRSGPASSRARGRARRPCPSGRSSAAAGRRVACRPVVLRARSSCRRSRLPSSSSTLEISPTSTPATLTVCPWPGVTACAVDSSASISKKSLPSTGTHAGQREPLVGEDHARPRAPRSIRPMIATKSRRCLRIAVLTGVPNLGSASAFLRGGRGRPVDVCRERRALVAGAVRLVRRAACPGTRAGCRAGRRRCCRAAAGSLPGRARPAVEPPPVWKRTYMPLPSKFWPSPARPTIAYQNSL